MQTLEWLEGHKLFVVAIFIMVAYLILLLTSKEVRSFTIKALSYVAKSIKSALSTIFNWIAKHAKTDISSAKNFMPKWVKPQWEDTAIKARKIIVRAGFWLILAIGTLWLLSLIPFKFSRESIPVSLFSAFYGIGIAILVIIILLAFAVFAGIKFIQAKPEIGTKPSTTESTTPKTETAKTVVSWKNWTNYTWAFVLVSLVLLFSGYLKWAWDLVSSSPLVSLGALILAVLVIRLLIVKKAIKWTGVTEFFSKTVIALLISVIACVLIFWYAESRGISLSEMMSTVLLVYIGIIVALSFAFASGKTLVRVLSGIAIATLIFASHQDIARRNIVKVMSRQVKMTDKQWIMTIQDVFPSGRPKPFFEANTYRATITRWERNGAFIQIKMSYLHNGNPHTRIFTWDKDVDPNYGVWHQDCPKQSGGWVMYRLSADKFQGTVQTGKYPLNMQLIATR